MSDSRRDILVSVSQTQTEAPTSVQGWYAYQFIYATQY